MIIQPTLDQTRRINRKRTYSGPGFGPRSFECLGLGLGLGLGTSSGAASGPTIQSILGAIPLAWSLDASGPGNTTPGGNTLTVAKDQSGNSRNFVFGGSAVTYSAAGGPGGNAYWQNGGANYLTLTGYAQPAPGTTACFRYGIVRVDTFATAAGLICSGTTNLAIDGAASANTYVVKHAGLTSAPVTAAVATWMRVWIQFAASASVDNLRMGAASVGTGTSFGNGAGTGSTFIGVDAQYLPSSHALWFEAQGIPSGAQIAALDAMYSSRFGAIAF